MVEVKGFIVATPQDPYFHAYVCFRHELQILEGMNKKLPKTIKSVMRKKVSELPREMNEKNLMKALKEIQEEREKLRKYGEVIAKINEEADGKKLKNVFLRIDPETDFGKLLSEGYNTYAFPRYAIVLIREMGLVYLVAVFESFLQKILSISFQKKPDILMTCRKNITYEELLKMNDIEDARMQIMEKEASIVNQDIRDVSKYFEQKFSIKMVQFVNWKEFEERFSRRNILLHNSGIPNKLYRLRTGYTGKDKKMSVSMAYLSDSINLFNSMAGNIAFNFQKKFK